MSRRARLLLLPLLLLPLSGGCKPPAPKEIKIGLITPLTGDV